MKLPEVAARLSVSVSFIRGLLASGRLKYHVLGKGQGARRVSEEQLQEYLRGTEKGGESRAVQKLPPPPRKLRHLSLD